ERVSYETRLEGDVPVYRAVLEADVVLEPGRRDPAFQLELASEPDSGTLRAGESLRLTVTPSKDCYVTVLHLDPQGGVERVFPNRFQPDHGVRGGTARTIPAPEDGFELRAELERGRHRQHEQILVVATLDPIRFEVATASDPDELVPNAIESIALSRLNRWLLEVPVDRRVEALWSYEIVE
ncbi:MAG TPA: DUF4384 domain-containing protein, partial [Candidatus Polarisedimenticolaceae bacterium]|nr:DUF4384 domain-containing protein [Candidatus Polarisedimenticolaceae bacterium]